MADCIRIGEAGVYRVMSELILRGHKPYKPGVDDHGVDLMLSSAIRLQVKTATLRTRQQKMTDAHGVISRYPKTRYHLSLGWTQAGRVHTPIRRKRMYSEECDYFIIWGVDENRFWIVPSFIMDGRTCLELGPKPLPSSKQIRDMAAQGKGLKEISETLGICEVTAWQHKKRDIEFGGFTRAVRACEDKWEFLNSSPVVWDQKNRTRKEEVEILEMMLEDATKASSTEVISQGVSNELRS